MQQPSKCATEAETVRAFVIDQLCEIETSGRSVSAFSSAVLLAASELYAEIHGGVELRKAFDEIAKVQQIYAGTAGRA